MHAYFSQGLNHEVKCRQLHPITVMLCVTCVCILAAYMSSHTEGLLYNETVCG